MADAYMLMNGLMISGAILFERLPIDVMYETTNDCRAPGFRALVPHVHIVSPLQS
jgi:hypothetical protein